MIWSVRSFLSVVPGVSHRKIARALKLSPTTVGNYIKGAEADGITLDRLNALSDQDLTAVLLKQCPQLLYG